MSEPRWGVPDNWEWSTAGEVANIIGGGTPSTSDQSNFTDEGIPWITPADLTGYGGIYISRGRRDLSQKGYASCGAQLMPQGTVLFSSRAPIGYCAIAQNEISTNQGFKSLVLPDDIIPEFTRYYLLSSKEYAESIASGTTFRELSGSRMATLPIPIAPTAEQRRIVAKLNSLFERAEAARDELARIPLLVEHYKRAILEKAFSGELTADWRGRQEYLSNPKKIIKECVEKCIRTRRSQQLSRYLVEPGTIPDEWAFARLEDICADIVDGTHHTPRYVENGVPFLSVKDIRCGRIHFDECRYISEDEHRELCRRCCPKKGDVLITKSGTIGRLAVVRSEQEFSLFVSVALIRSASAQIDPWYIAYALENWIRSINIGSEITGSAIKNLHLQDIKALSVPIPSHEEQQEIVRRVEAAFEWLSVVEREQGKAAHLLDHLDRGLLAKAFRGELVAQDPNDEPAEKLLERIRAKRAAPGTMRRGRRRKAE